MTPLPRQTPNSSTPLSPDPHRGTEILSWEERELLSSQYKFKSLSAGSALLGSIGAGLVSYAYFRAIEACDPSQEQSKHTYEVLYNHPTKCFLLGNFFLVLSILSNLVIACTPENRRN